MLRRHFAAAVLGLALLGGCGGDPGQRPAPGRQAADQQQLQAKQTTRPAVSSGESLQVLDEYVAKFNKAATGADGRSWQALLGEPLSATAGARLRIGHGRPPERRAIALVNPVLFVPRLDGYPKWFVAAAMERRGRTGRPHQALLMFTRSGPDAPWLLANRTITAQKLPKIATDGQGYAIAVTAATPGRLAVNLNDLAATHAAYLTSGSGSTFAAGPYTSAWRDGQSATSKRLRDGGWLDTAAFAQTRYPLAALRTKDGGVLAWYALSRVDSLVSASHAAPDPGAVSREVRDYLGKPPRGARTEVRAAWLLLPLAYVPPGGQVSVLGLTTDLTSADTIQH
jgi:hypothetical protein